MSELPPALSPRGRKAEAAPQTDGPPRADAAAAAPVVPSATTPRVQVSDSGLTAPGVFVVVLTVTLVGLIIDAFTIDSGWIFGVLFVLSSGYAALQVRRRDLPWAVIAPPLVFLLLTLGREIIDPGAGSGLSSRLLDVTARLAESAPALWAGTALAGVIVLVRWRGWFGRS